MQISYNKVAKESPNKKEKLLGGGWSLPEADDADAFVAVDHVHAGGIVLKQKSFITESKF